jgi:hypothetical protein
MQIYLEYRVSPQKLDTVILEPRFILGGTLFDFMQRESYKSDNAFRND